MRDLLVITIVALAAIVALRRPWVGVMLWVWLSLMNPHRYAFGFAYDAPVAMIAALATLMGALFEADKKSPFKGAPVAWFMVFIVWITLSWLLGLDPRSDRPQWEKVIKIDLMTLLALALLHSKKHILALAWICTLSIAILGAKGGVFTLVGGGAERVWGPSGSFIEDNNEFALAVVMTIPLLRFLQLQLARAWQRHLLTLTMLLCAIAALGSYSRGGFVAIVAMSLLLWWRGKSRFWGGAVLLIAGVAIISFMPDAWTERMSTIETYEGDRSVLGRFSAWWVSWRVAFDYPFGVGFNIARPELFFKYSPYPELGAPVAHSIYFQVLGHHGFVGLFLFLMIWATTWWSAGQLRRAASALPQAQWCADLAGMCQVSLFGYLVGGAFLSLSYFDFPYYVMVLVVLAHAWVRRRAWELEPGGLTAAGLAGTAASSTRPATAAAHVGTLARSEQSRSTPS